MVDNFEETIDKIESIFSDWIKPLANDREPLFSLPAEETGDPTVHIYLLDITDDPVRLNTGRPPCQPSLRYLITTAAGDVRAAHKLLAKVLAYALEQPDYQIEFEAASSPLWSALQTPARPAFFLRVPLNREWPPLRGYRVKEVTVGLHGLVWLYGQVLGPDDIPITEAHVELKDLNKYAYTDRKGRFTIPGIPDSNSPKKLVVSARGIEQAFTFNDTGTLEQPYEFHIDIPDLPHDAGT